MATNTVLNDEATCASEPIHRLGRVQSHGVVLTCRLEDFRILACSENVAVVLQRPLNAVLGAPLSNVEPAVVPLVLEAARAEAWPDGSPHRVQRRLTVGSDGRSCDVSCHRWNQVVVVEIQPESDGPPSVDAAQEVDAISHRLGLTSDIVELCAVACTEIQRLTGYQRVLAYQFDEEWNGEVIAEKPRGGEAVRFLGLHFPASDIPPQARALYHAVPLRVIADARDEGACMIDECGTPIAPDLSHALLRSVSSMHLAYLRNMGVEASIAISLMVEGRLWGLVVAHDDRARVPPQHVVNALRVVCRLMGQLVSARLLALEHRRQQVDDRGLLHLIERIPFASLTSPGPRTVWTELRDELLAWFQADGGLLVHDGEPVLHGGPDELPALDGLAALRARGIDAVFASSNLHRDGLAAAGSIVAGLLWIPTPIPGHGLLVWRKEAQREVFWGGDPAKPTEDDPAGRVLGPRRSFERWREVRRDHSLPWTPTHLEGARRVAAQWHLLVLAQHQQRAESTIRRLEAGILRVNDGVVIARSDPDVGLRVDFANPLFERLLHGGASARDAVPAFLDPRVVGDKDCDALRRVIARGAPAQLEFLAHDGRWFEIALTPVTELDGDTCQWAAILRDTTVRHRDEALKDEQSQALQAINDRFTQILETSHEGILTLDEQGRVDYCNPRMLEILRMPSAPAGWMLSALVADHADATWLLDAGMPTHAIRRRELELLQADGRVVACDVALIRLRAEGRQRSGWLAMVSDISERKSLENSLLLLNSNLEATIAERTAELVSAKEAADDANRSKSEFLANMSHELRSPLHGILGFTRLLMEDTDITAAKRATYLGKVERNASNLLALVNDLLDSAKIESKSFSIQIARCDLAEIARNVIGEFQADSSTHSTLRAALPLAAPCHGDAFRLAQVLRNLLANAIRFSPKGSRVHVAVERTGPGWTMSVRDRGPGIPPGELDAIFERFSQSSTTKTGAGGTGLGLHIARGILRSHGGTLRAANRDGGGAVFEAFIPDLNNAGPILTEETA